MPPKPASLLDRLISHRWIDPSTGCWLSVRTPNKYEYFRITYKGAKRLIHRLSAVAFLGMDLNSKLQTNHKPLCPYKACFNPDHIYAGTAKENSKDYSNSKTHCKNGHELNEVNTYMTVLVHGPRRGNEVKNCRICGKLNSQRRRRLYI